MKIDRSIVEDLLRLDGYLCDDSNPDLTLDNVEWPSGNFCIPIPRFKALLIEQGATGLEDHSDEDFSGSMPVCARLKFVDENTQGLDCEYHLTGVTDEFYFAYNEYGYFFLREDPRAPGFPDVLYVNHERPSEPPCTCDERVNVTLQQLFNLLEPE